MAEVSAIMQNIEKQVNNLSPELQHLLLDFAQALAKSHPKGVSGKEFLRFSGIIGAEDIQAMTQAIEASCEQVDVNEW